MAFIESGVPLADVAKVLKTSVAKVEDEVRALAVFVGVDWANRPAVGQHDAHELVTGLARERAGHDEAWRAHLAAVAEWEDRRAEVTRAASQAAYGAAVRAQKGAPRAGSDAREAAIAAGETFERQNPLPRFAGGESAGSLRYTNAKSGIVRRLLLGGVR